MRKHNYLVGYEGEGQVIYDKKDSLELLTLNEAKRLRKKITTPNNPIIKSVIYKLVKV